MLTRLSRAVLEAPMVAEHESTRAADIPDVERFRAHYRAAVAELTPIVEGFGRREMEVIGKHNWGWVRSDFSEYMRESEPRFVNAYTLMRASLSRRARLLDVGGFLAPFPLALRKAGFAVTVAEHYGYYGDVLEPVVQLLRQNDVEVLDADFCSGPVEVEQKFDAVLCMAVAEHLASSPRALMTNIRKALSVDGKLVFEVPNQLAWVNRVRVIRGHTFMPTLETIWNSAVPFTGHHHEYTEEDVRALMRLSEFRIERFEFLNAYYGLDTMRAKLLYRVVPRFFPRTRDTMMVLADVSGRSDVAAS